MQWEGEAHTKCGMLKTGDPPGCGSRNAQETDVKFLNPKEGETQHLPHRVPLRTL